MPLSSRGKSGTVGDFLFFYVPANTFIFDSGVLRASYRAFFPVGLNRLHSQFGVDRQFVFTLMKETLPSSRNQVQILFCSVQMQSNRRIPVCLSVSYLSAVSVGCRLRFLFGGLIFNIHARKGSPHTYEYKE